MPQLDSSIIWTIVGTIIGVSATVIVCLFQRKKTLLQYYISTTPLITEKMAGILNDRMSIDGQPVKSMSSTTISFVNSGNQRIQFSDFSTQEPLRVILEGHLYGYDVSLGNQKLLPKVTPADEKTLHISFENLKPKQFFRVTILHDEADETLEVLGELTTGTMREYVDSNFFWIFITIYVVNIALIVDYIFNGPFYALIGDFEFPLLVILSFALMSLFAVEIYLNRRKRKLFIH